MVVFLAVGAVVVIVGVIVVIAFGFIAREGRRMAIAPPPPVFSLDEAYAWVVDRVPDAVAATLTPDDVKRILAAQVAYLRETGAAVGRGSAGTSDAPVVDLSVAVSAVIERTRTDDEEYIPEQVRPVIETLFVYMQEIGAIAGPVD